MAKAPISPGMQQYLDIKAQHPDALLFFRMGDFYELFYEDAQEAARILELTLTSRNKHADAPIPMAGVPYHSASQYIETLVGLGYKVAIAEQMEDPKTVKGVVKRAIVQVVTPGTVQDMASGEDDNNFLVAIAKDTHGYALSYMDVSTGQFCVTHVSAWEALVGEIRNLKAKEVVLACELQEAEESVLRDQMNLVLSRAVTAMSDSPLMATNNVSSLEKEAAGHLLGYVHETQMRDLVHLQNLEHYEISDFLQMDYATKTSLDLLENARTKKRAGSLFAYLNQTKTAMGLRLLRAWLDRPLIEEDAILERQKIVKIFLEHFFERSDVIDSLKGVYDIERLTSRVSFGKITPKDLLQLAQSLSCVPVIADLLETMNDPDLSGLLAGLDPLEELLDLIVSAINPDAPMIITEGNIIRDGFDDVLDDYRIVMRDAASWIADLEVREKEASGIPNLKIDYNRKDGYFFHVTNSHLDKVPDHFIRKATLKNAERYETEELKRIEARLSEAKEKSANLEYDIFMRLRLEVTKYVERLQLLSSTIATIDVLQAFAVVAEKHHLVAPKFTKTRVIQISQGRHAVVEAIMGAQTYVPNDIMMDESTQVALITGPNMSGKSTYMRQLAVCVIMAQIGSFVAAQEAILPVFDAIFTRIGAADDLVSGQSTFMVEMMEANKAIRLATPDSLILFDELGRGTATYDGMALADAIITYLHDKVGAKTLFATHYHELTALSERLSKLSNLHVATLEKEGEVTFLHQIANGPADKSYGIHAAKIAGLPQELLDRAQETLETLEGQTVSHSFTLPPSEERGDGQLSLLPDDSDVLSKLASLNPDQMTPLEALIALADLKKGL